MKLISEVLDQLEQHGNNMVIVDIRDIHREFENVFEFMDECQRRNPNVDYELEFLRPKDHDGGNEDKIVLMSNPARITEHNVLDTRIYIVEDTKNLKRSLIKYRVN